MGENRIKIVVVENRGMIRDILVDILAARGYEPLCVPTLNDARSLLAADPSVALLMVDVGLLGGREATLAALTRISELGARGVVLFSCVETMIGPDVHLLRAPSDFSAVADVVQMRLSPAQQTRLGELLIESGVLTPSALQAVLAVQEELGKLGRRPLLGQLLVNLGFVSRSDVSRALRRQAGLPPEGGTDWLT